MAFRSPVPGWTLGQLSRRPSCTLSKKLPRPVVDPLIVSDGLMQGGRMMPMSVKGSRRLAVVLGSVALIASLDRPGLRAGAAQAGHRGDQGGQPHGPAVSQLQRPHRFRRCDARVDRQAGHADDPQRQGRSSSGTLRPTRSTSASTSRRRTPSIRVCGAMRSSTCSTACSESLIASIRCVGMISPTFPSFRATPAGSCSIH